MKASKRAQGIQWLVMIALFAVIAGMAIAQEPPPAPPDGMPMGGPMLMSGPGPMGGEAFDGKTVKGSRQKDGRPVHLMSAVAHTTQRLLNQIPVAEKSNEIPAFRPLLEALPLRNVVITADAEQCQRANAQFVVYQKEGDYIFLAKGNQPSLEALAQTKLSGAFPPGSPNQR